jgi:transketolase
VSAAVAPGAARPTPVPAPSGPSDGLSLAELCVNFLVDRAGKDPDLYYITADGTLPGIAAFYDRYPDRFINAGIAEQNAVSIGAGLAMSGKNVYLWNASTFLLYRPFDQIRLDAAYAGTRLRLIGTGVGYGHGLAGIAHTAIEDVAITRALPGMTVVSPGEHTELMDLLAEIDELPGPVYIRLPAARGVLPVLHPQGTRIRLGSAAVLREGELGTLIATGESLERAAAWVDEWRRRGLAVRLVSMPSIKPLDTAAVERLVAEGLPIATLEEHSIIGGLGSAVAEAVAEAGGGVPFRRIGLPDQYPHQPGSDAHIKKALGVPGPEEVLAWFLTSPGARKPGLAAAVGDVDHDWGTRDQRRADDLPFWRDLARRHGPDVLELAAGGGSISPLLAEDGHNVAGIDVAPATSNEAERKSRLPFELHEAGLRDFHLGRRFGLVILPCDTIGHLLSVSGLAACLAYVHDHLNDGGVLALGMVNLETGPATEADGDGRPSIPCCDEAAEVVRARHSGMLNADHAEQLLKAAGFAVLQRYGGYASEPWTQDSRHVVLVCGKESA